MTNHWIKKSAARVGDMHPTRSIRVEAHADGDYEVAIVDEDGIPLGFGNGVVASVEFCSSGGRSHAVRKALHALIAAIEEDAKSRPDAIPQFLRE